MRFIYLHILLLLCGELFSQSKKHLYADANLKIEYHTKDGLIDGKYISHYANGRKKSEGHFKNNLRDGKWMIWDSTGKMHTEYNVPIDTLKRNSTGFFDFLYLRQQDVLMEKRVWKEIHPQNNSILFNHKSLFDSLYRQIQKDNLSIYKDDDFITERPKEEIKKVFSSERFEIIGYKLKADCSLIKKQGTQELRLLEYFLF